MLFRSSRSLTEGLGKEGRKILGADVTFGLFHREASEAERAFFATQGRVSAVATMREAFDRRRQTIVSMLREIPGVACPEPQGAFYVYPSVKGLLGRPIAGRTATTSTELAELILEEAEVAVVPGEAFGTPGYLRMSYALGDDDLVEGVSRMQRLLGSAE